MQVNRYYSLVRNKSFYFKMYKYFYNLKISQSALRPNFIHSSSKMAFRILIFSTPLNWNSSMYSRSPAPALSLPSPKRKVKFDSILWFVSVLWDVLQSVIRSIQLTCTFTPILILYPFSNINHKLKSAWYQLLLFGIGISGPIMIKLGQWASTRRDLFSKEFCIILTKLQRKTTPHSWYYTRKCLEYAYGPEWQEIFVKFDNNGEPIGSGCCAQVYKAWIRNDKIPSSNTTVNEEYLNSFEFLCVEVMETLHLGYFSSYSKKIVDDCETTDYLIPVAVKVRHPHMERKFRQDLNILKFIACTITWLIPGLQWLSLNESVDEFSKVMESQVNFYTEADNLLQFTANFRDSKSVVFPLPFVTLSRSNILVEAFENGQNIDDFISHHVEKKTRQYLASTGVDTILKMVFHDNFIHGDLHPGNILVKNVTNDCSNLKANKIPYILVILDCGIVSSLDERGKICLKKVFSAVASGDGERVAELFLEYSNHQCSDVDGFKKKMKEIVERALHNTVTLSQVDVGELMNSLFSTMINYRVKADSRFSSVILAIMVIEGLGRSLDPTIDVLKRAKPFLFSSSF